MDRLQQLERASALERNKGRNMSYDSLYKQFAEWGSEDFLSSNRPHFMKKRFEEFDRDNRRHVNGTTAQLPPGCPTAMVAVAAQVNLEKTSPRRRATPSANQSRRRGKLPDSDVVKGFAKVVTDRNMKSIKAYIETYPSIVDYRLTEKPKRAQGQAQNPQPDQAKASAQPTRRLNTNRAKPSPSNQAEDKSRGASSSNRTTNTTTIRGCTRPPSRTANPSGPPAPIPKFKVWHLAVCTQDVELCKMLYKLCNGQVGMEERDPEGFLPLHRAVQCNDYELFEFLVRHGALVDQNDANGFPTVSLVVRTAKGLARHRMLEALVRVELAIDKPDLNRRTALYHAVERHDQFSTDKLLEHGASPESTDDEGTSIMLLALQQQKNELIGSIVNRCRRVLTVEYLNERRCGVLHVAVLLRNAKMLAYLISLQPDLVNVVDAKGETAAHYAVHCRSLPCLTVLVRGGAPLEAKNHELLTPLQVAAILHETDMEVLLRKHGARADVDKKSNETGKLIDELGHLGAQHKRNPCFRQVPDGATDFMFRHGRLGRVLTARRSAMIEYEQNVRVAHAQTIQQNPHLKARAPSASASSAATVRSTLTRGSR